MVSDNLGSCYFNGDGVIKNYIEADKWIIFASVQGYELAKKMLPIDEGWMTPEQTAEAQDLPKSLQTATPKFEEVVKSAQDAAVLVLVY